MEAEYSTLYLQVASGLFEDRTGAAGLAIPTLPTVGFGTAIADLDQDGDLDLVSGNGRIRRPEKGLYSTTLESFWLPFADRNEIFLNGGDGIFTGVTAAEDDFLAHRHVTRGLAMGDLDDDGDLDMVTSEINGPARILLNIAKPKGNWLMVRAVDPRYGGRDAYGATVTVAAGKQRWSRDINPAYSYLSSNDPRAHFGLGTESKYDGITVLWPDGKREKFPCGNPGKSLTLSRGTGVQP